MVRQAHPDLSGFDKLRAGVSGYKGAGGDTIRIRATDDFKVKQVQVTISNADGG